MIRASTLKGKSIWFRFCEHVPENWRNTVLSELDDFGGLIINQHGDSYVVDIDRNIALKFVKQYLEQEEKEGRINFLEDHAK